MSSEFHSDSDSGSEYECQVIDMQGQPMTMQSLFMILQLIGSGQPVIVKNGVHENASEILHRMELMYIARHEAGVQRERERLDREPR